MILIEVSQVSADRLPIAPLKQHLRLGSGFADDDVQDGVLEGYLRAALSAIEGRTGQVIFQRQFRWILDEWRDETSQPFPLAPVESVDALSLIDAEGVAEAQPLGTLVLSADPLQPRLQAVAGSLPKLPAGGRAEVLITAGAATDWSEVPPDLAQAVLLMAAHYYEYRNDVALGKGCTPFGVTALLERYRPIRIGLGGGA
ncbi:head-tail connector protein [Pseudooceanicola sp. 200-1SW]|uniref:head-tail connector protein n=1 Tax=Pseudooceanicola sp. 200-1SW TaxID=3425949 RepID=UPI003D7FAB6E